MTTKGVTEIVNGDTKRAKLTKQDKLDIKEALQNGAKGKDLANKYNVSKGAISRIKNGSL